MENKKEQKKGFLIGPVDLKWEDIPFYRKRWFMAVLFLFFIPAMIIIDLTGDVYARHKGEVYKVKHGHFALSGSIFMFFGLLRLLIS